MSYELKKYKKIIFDFDGVFTDNCIYYGVNDLEIMKFSKDDSLALDILRKFISEKKIKIDLMILTRDKNEIITRRAKVMKLKLFTGIFDKYSFVNDLINKENKKSKIKFKEIIYLGNGLNDYKLMKRAGLSFAPIDSNKLVKNISTHILNKKGGDGVVLEFLNFFIDTTDQLNYL